MTTAGDCLGNGNESIVFDTLSGPLEVKRVGGAEGSLLEMDFPAYKLSYPTSPPGEEHDGEVWKISKQLADVGFLY